MFKVPDPKLSLPVMITPYLYLSDVVHVRDIGVLKDIGITHILNMASRYCQSPDYSQEGMIKLNIDAFDEVGYKLLTIHFGEAYEFIEKARKSNGKCLVHCVGGVNRSGVIAASYMMVKERKTVLDVVAHCRYQRGSEFLSNETFQAELVAMARVEGLLGPEPGAPGCCVKIKAPSKTVTLKSRAQRYQD